MDPRQQQVDEQFLMDMIAEGDGQGGNVDEQVDDGSNIDIYLNMSGDGCEPPSRDDDAAADQDANVHITTALLVFKLCLHPVLTCIQSMCMKFLQPSGSSSQQKKTKRGPTKKLEGRYIMTEVAPDGEPISPVAAAKKYIRQSGCIVRNHIPISFRLWKAYNSSEERDVVPKREKEWCW